MKHEVEAGVGREEEQAQNSDQDRPPAACEDAENSRECEASAPVDESETILQRLASHLRKPDKFVKASKLLRRLLVQPEKSMALDGKTVPCMQSKIFFTTKIFHSPLKCESKLRMHRKFSRGAGGSV